MDNKIFKGLMSYMKFNDKGLQFDASNSFYQAPYTSFKL